MLLSKVMLTALKVACAACGGHCEWRFTDQPQGYSHHSLLLWKWQHHHTLLHHWLLGSHNSRLGSYCPELVVVQLCRTSTNPPQQQHDWCMCQGQLFRAVKGNHSNNSWLWSDYTLPWVYHWHQKILWWIPNYTWTHHANQPPWQRWKRIRLLVLEWHHHQNWRRWIPTLWVNSLVYWWKQNWKSRLYLDPKGLNTAIQRVPHYPYCRRNPTKVDRNFMQVLERCSWQGVKWPHHFQLPFRQTQIQPHIFQTKIDQKFQGCKGVGGIADNIMVFGKTIEVYGTLHRC